MNEGNFRARRPGIRWCCVERPGSGFGASQGYAFRLLAGGGRIDHTSICRHPMLKDAFPIVGFAPGDGMLYLAVTHSDVTLAPFIGQLAALEIPDGVTVNLLANSPPGRFNSVPPGKE